MTPAFDPGRTLAPADICRETQALWERNRQVLMREGHDVQPLRQVPTFVEAEVTCVLTRSGDLFKGTLDAMHQSVEDDTLVFHEGVIRGAWTRLGGIAGKQV